MLDLKKPPQPSSLRVVPLPLAYSVSSMEGSQVLDGVVMIRALLYSRRASKALKIWGVGTLVPHLCPVWL